MVKTVADENFSDFPLGAFPYDKEHSAMGEYHYYPEEGYKGNWLDPITNWNYKGPTWLVTSPFMSNVHVMEQMRVQSIEERQVLPTLRTGDEDWTDYTLTVKMRPLTVSEPCGMLFRYQTSMMHYGLFLSREGLELHRVVKTERTVLGCSKLEWSPDVFHAMTVKVEGSLIRCYLDGSLEIETEDDTFTHGAVALSAAMPTQYLSLSVEMDESISDELAGKKARKAERIRKESEMLPKAELWKKIDLKDFGAGRQIRFGHLTGTDELFFIICQHQRRVYKDRYPFISAMTAVSFKTGEILWQLGEPVDDDEVIHLTTDLPFQIYDINGDGIDEVITAWDFKLRILDGRTGKVLSETDTPIDPDPPEKVTGLEFGKYAFKRLNVDAIRIVNVQGKERASDILIKDRYSRIWIYDSDLKPLWTFSKYNTGHFPYNIDINGDGKDEIFSCYNMIDSSGHLLWSLPIETDHTDEIIVGRTDPDKEPVIAIVSGWEGFMLVSLSGKILVRDINGHGQRISIGNYIPENKGLEICTTTYWGANGIIYMHDSEGKEIWHKEWPTNGSIITPVNWDGSGRDLLLMTGDGKTGGLMNGNGDIVVRFPNDGHPTLAAEVLDVTGDERDEIILWDRKSMWIYTPSGEAKRPDGRIYDPIRYPSYNGSNYRGEFSFPRWR